MKVLGVVLNVAFVLLGFVPKETDPSNLGAIMLMGLIGLVGTLSVWRFALLLGYSPFVSFIGGLACGTIMTVLAVTIWEKYQQNKRERERDGK